MPSQEKIIQIQNVIKRFPVGGTNVTVLNGINVDIHAGQFLAIVGPSGNGKSTLLNMITGIDRPSSGDVVVSGQSLSRLSENQLAIWRAENIGIVFQFFQLLPSLNLLQNVLLPMEFASKIPRSQRRSRAMDLLEMVGLADQAGKLPGTISGGQQQRAAIARALSNDPPIIVADEPTGNLDANTADDVFCLFLGLAREGKTLVMVTHNLELAEKLPRRIQIVNGLVQSDQSAYNANGAGHEMIQNLQDEFACKKNQEPQP